MTCKIIKGNLFGINISTNLDLPINFPRSVNYEYGKEKTILLCDKICDSDYQTYYKSDKSDVLYKYCKNKHSYIIETDKIGSVKVDSNNIFYRQSIYTNNNTKYMPFLLSFGFGIAAMLRLNNYIVLHASALSLKGKNVLIMGPSGVGKTTLCSYLIKNHSAVLISDDMSCINTTNCMLYSGFPMMRLWPETINHIFAVRCDDLNVIGKNGKRYFPISNTTNMVEHNVDIVVILRKAIGQIPSLVNLDAKQLFYNLVKHIYNRPSLDSVALSNEMAGICKAINANGTQGIILNNPRTYETLSWLSDILTKIIIEN